MKAKIKYEDYYKSQASLGYIVISKQTTLATLCDPAYKIPYMQAKQGLCACDLFSQPGNMVSSLRCPRALFYAGQPSLQNTLWTRLHSSQRLPAQVNTAITHGRLRHRRATRLESRELRGNNTNGWRKKRKQQRRHKEGMFPSFTSMAMINHPDPKKLTGVQTTIIVDVNPGEQSRKLRWTKFSYNSQLYLEHLTIYSLGLIRIT